MSSEAPDLGFTTTKLQKDNADNAFNPRYLILFRTRQILYGDPLEHPQKETHWGNVNPIGERSYYDEGKRTAETLVMDYHRGADVEVRMCLDDGRVVSNFVAQAIRRQPLTVYGDGKQTRSFQYVSDLVNGLVALMDGEHEGPFNLGNLGEFNIVAHNSGQGYQPLFWFLLNMITWQSL